MLLASTLFKATSMTKKKKHAELGDPTKDHINERVNDQQKQRKEKA